MANPLHDNPRSKNIQESDDFSPLPNKKYRGIEYENIPQSRTKGITIDRPDPGAGDNETPHETKDKDGKIFYWRQRRPTS